MEVCRDDPPMRVKKLDRTFGVCTVVDNPGSLGHAEYRCRPCAHVWKEGGCVKGAACTYCHICGEADFRAYQSIKKAWKKSSKVKNSGVPGSGDVANLIAYITVDGVSRLGEGNTSPDSDDAASSVDSR